MITNETRLIYSVPLEPAFGSTFQPTGFPDIGAATFDRFDPDQAEETVESLLVESVQSMANRLEATCWDTAEQRPIELVSPLPYVRVHHADDDRYLTSSRLEAHRLSSPFVRTATTRDGKPMIEVIRDALGLAKDTPLNFRRMSAAVAGLDPFCLLHGVFFNQKEWFGQPKFARATTAVIEAYHVRRAVSGGRKSDHVRHGTKNEDKETGRSSEGYGSIPFHRTEWTAKEIRAFFSVDVALLRSYGLPPAVTELLTCLALWEIRAFLAGGLRLRTACDLVPVGNVEPLRGGQELPPGDDLGQRITTLVPDCGDTFGDGEPLVVAWKGKG